MREYEFRGKPISPSSLPAKLAWAYGDLVQKDGKTYIAPSHNRVKVENNLARLMILIEVDPKTVGQYTGLKDKNGKKTYEGDITRNCKTSVLSWFKSDDSAGTYEVIGNIHDNPELLEGLKRES